MLKFIGTLRKRSLQTAKLPELPNHKGTRWPAPKLCYPARKTRLPPEKTHMHLYPLSLAAFCILNSDGASNTIHLN